MKAEKHRRQGSTKDHQEGPTRELFRKFAHKPSEAVGSPAAFISAIAMIMMWAFSGPLFHFSDTWQLIINTGTTIITFLMVFLIQYAESRCPGKSSNALRGNRGSEERRSKAGAPPCWTRTRFFLRRFYRNGRCSILIRTRFDSPPSAWPDTLHRPPV